ncbi:uncharacterized protein FOMMEDRAFT_67030, partial [Fomitiporia mediterranea MF3/22]|uniref:uncharacterized protein n=1 Tax=Fomitiporia mediterranea (strain MF3/22) TaxID=694068 RepID=UPI000440797A
TKTALKMFFLLMTIYPEVVMKAQKEIDCIIGRVCLPCIANRENLPYLSCIL